MIEGMRRLKTPDMIAIKTFRKCEDFWVGRKSIRSLASHPASRRQTLQMGSDKGTADSLLLILSNTEPALSSLILHPFSEALRALHKSQYHMIILSCA